jgi:predicted AlkP superfamily pyrophosphatase or phosphodiesterase
MSIALKPDRESLQRLPSVFRMALLVVALLLLGCGDSDPSVQERLNRPESDRQMNGAKPTRGRLLLIGIDGASPGLTRELMQAGRLPNLAKLAAGGIWGPVRSMIPLESPRIWATIATGKFPNKHRIRSFGYRDEEGKIRLYLSTDRKTHALWNITSAAGRSTSVINWWTTYPPERIAGVMVSDHAIPEEFRYRLDTFEATDDGYSAPEIYPAEWSRRLAPLVTLREPATETAHPFAEKAAFPPFVNTEALEAIYRVDNATARMAFEVAKGEEPDVYLVYLKGIDRMSHHLWGMLEPASSYPENLRPSDQSRRAGAEAIYRYYEFTDAVIGKLIAGYGADDLVMVVSDHGFQADVIRDNLTGGHHDQTAIHGVLFARGPGIRVGQPLPPNSKIKDITPTLLAWLGLPTALDMDGEVAAYLTLPGGAAIEPIETYDTSPIERVGSVAGGSEEQILKELRALGYLE